MPCLNSLKQAQEVTENFCLCLCVPPWEELWRTKSSHWVSPDLFQIVISHPKLIRYTSERSLCLTHALLFCWFFAASMSSAVLEQLIDLFLAPKYTQQVTAFIDFPFSSIHKELLSSSHCGERSYYWSTNKLRLHTCCNFFSKAHAR